MELNQALIDTIVEQAKNYPQPTALTGDDENYQRFINKFPREQLKQLTLKDYCMGKGSEPENFCWWIERGLQRSLARYSPGSARGHLIYLQKDGTYYKNKQLEEWDEANAMAYIAKIIYAIANCRSPAEAEALDDPQRLAALAGVEDVKMTGEARILHILGIYNPEWVLPINSPRHIRHFLIEFGYEKDELPKTPVALLLELSKIYNEVNGRLETKLTPYAFMRVLYSEELKLKPKTRSVENVEDIDTNTEASMPLNQILYGPPGTGKTYQTINRALSIIDPTFYKDHKENREMIKAKFDEYMKLGRIGFVTFHQSYSYEEFVEGIKASTNEKGEIQYQVEDGIFKELCISASISEHSKSTGSVDLAGKRIWKMSLGNTLGEDDFIFDECIENNFVLLGWGGSIDFSGCKSKEDIAERFQQDGFDLNEQNYGIYAVNTFMNVIKSGDIVIISDGNKKYRAIGEFTGSYKFVDDVSREGYKQSRDVVWHKVFTPSKPANDLFKKSISQMTLYELKGSSIDKEYLSKLLNTTVSNELVPYVLIIDEINRGNIAKIFGELITLLEPSKRSGNEEQLSVLLPYSKEPFSVPNNLFVIGTMNTADRSLAQLDIALRRRFTFEELLPDHQLLKSIGLIEGIDVMSMVEAINARIEIIYDKEHTLGHSIFLPLREDPSLGLLATIFEYQVLPLLEEYFFEDWEKISQILGDHLKSQKKYRFINEKFTSQALQKLMGEAWSSDQQLVFERNAEALEMPESYIGIYDASSMNMFES